MKIFVSWSGKFSCEIAKILKKWIPCILQSVDVFFSSEDIEKGENWDKTLSTELSECKYGIICLTTENTTAPWIHFEAGAIAKSLDSRIAALMINIKPSDIKGPLSRYQATKFERNDFFQLISSINSVLENPLNPSTLQNTFDAMWTSLEQEVTTTISKYSKGVNSLKKDETDNELLNSAPLEEILQILRQQSAILSNPEKLIPIEYLNLVQRKITNQNRDLYADNEIIIEEVLNYMDNLFEKLDKFEKFEKMEKLEKFGKFSNVSTINEFIRLCNFGDLVDIILHNANSRNNKRILAQICRIGEKYHTITRYRSNNSVEKIID